MCYENFERLCKENHVTPSKVSKATGISTATLTSWKQGKYTPKREKMKLIADYFNVSVDFLITGKDSQFDYLYTDENAEFLIEITQRARDREFVDRIRRYMSLMNESQESVNNMIDLLYKKERGQD